MNAHGSSTLCRTPAPRRQVDHPVDAPLYRQQLHRLPVGDIDLVEDEARLHQQVPQAVFLHAYVVSVVQVVDPHHRVTRCEQHARRPRPNEPGCAGYQIVSHASILPYSPDGAAALSRAPISAGDRPVSPTEWHGYQNPVAGSHPSDILISR